MFIEINKEAQTVLVLSMLSGRPIVDYISKSTNKVTIREFRNV